MGKIRNKKLRRAVIKSFIARYIASHPCVDCGETDPIVLELDHVLGKNHEFHKLKRNRGGLERIVKELALCQVRCANCHRRKTFREKEFLGLKPSTNGDDASQLFLFRK